MLFSQRSANNLFVSPREHTSVRISRRCPGEVLSEKWAGRLHQSRPADFTIPCRRELRLNQVSLVGEQIDIIPARGQIDARAGFQGGHIRRLPNLFSSRRFRQTNSPEDFAE